MSSLLQAAKEQAKHQSDLVLGAWTGGFMLPPVVVTIFSQPPVDSSYWDRLQLATCMIILVSLLYFCALRIVTQLHAKARALAIVAFSLPIFLWIVVLAKVTPLLLISAAIGMTSMIFCSWLAKRRIYHYELNRIADDAAAYRSLSA